MKHKGRKGGFKPLPPLYHNGTTVTGDNNERIICPIELATGKSSCIFPEYKTDRNYQKLAKMV